VYCNDLYTKHFMHTKPEVLAKGKGIIGNVIIHPTAEVHPTAVLGPNVTIGANVRIGEGVRINNSLVLDRVEVRDHACVMYAILAWDSGVGSWARVEGNLIASLIATQILMFYLTFSSLSFFLLLTLTHPLILFRNS
jgi:mannose-1-phosphate guanylyltransferase